MEPDAKEVSAQKYDEIQFVDCGGNFQGIHCPSCDGELAVQWRQRAWTVRTSSVSPTWPWSCPVAARPHL
jgi:hypothetical protein